MMLNDKSSTLKKKTLSIVECPSRTQTDEDEDNIDDLYRCPPSLMPSRKSRMSVTWNRDFNRADLVKRRRSIGDPKEARRIHDFNALRELGEASEFTSALEKTGTGEKVIKRRYSSHELIKGAARQLILSRSNFEIPKNGGMDETSTDSGYDNSEFSDTDSVSVASSEGSAPGPPMIYRVSVLNKNQQDITALKQRAKSIVIEQDQLNHFVYSFEKNADKLNLHSRSSLMSDKKSEEKNALADDDNASRSYIDDPEPVGANMSFRWYDIFYQMHNMLREACDIL